MSEQEHATILRPAAPDSARGRGMSSALPADLLDRGPRTRPHPGAAAPGGLSASTSSRTRSAGSTCSRATRLRVTGPRARCSSGSTSVRPRRRPACGARGRQRAHLRHAPPHRRPRVRGGDLSHDFGADVLAVLQREPDAAQPDVGTVVLVLFPLIMPGLRGACWPRPSPQAPCSRWRCGCWTPPATSSRTPRPTRGCRFSRESQSASRTRGPHRTASDRK